MTNRERFHQTMTGGTPDRVPLFDEGVRDEVIAVWRQQGLAPDADLPALFGLDAREEIVLDLECRPKLERWPTSRAGLDALRRHLDPRDPARFAQGWPQQVRQWASADRVLMLRVHRGFFLSMGVHDWTRFTDVMYLCADAPDFVRELMTLQGEFAARMTDIALQNLPIDAAIFSEPIGGNDRPLVSPQMYEQLVLPTYQPVLDVLARHDVNTVIFRTYANAKVLLPAVLKRGFNCLWVSETNARSMDYLRLRREFGPELRLIGGIRMDALRAGRRAMRREIKRVVPPLLAQGRCVPMAGGRVREDISLADYRYYRGLLTEAIPRQG